MPYIIKWNLLCAFGLYQFHPQLFQCQELHSNTQFSLPLSLPFSCLIIFSLTWGEYRDHCMNVCVPCCVCVCVLSGLPQLTRDWRHLLLFNHCLRLHASHDLVCECVCECVTKVLCRGKVQLLFCVDVFIGSGCGVCCHSSLSVVSMVFRTNPFFQFLLGYGI